MIGLIMLVVFVLYLLVAILITSWLTRIPKRAPYKWLTALLSLAVFALIPTWDEILGRMYFKHLCETEGGVRVYKTVELGPEYWNADGMPRFILENGNADEQLLGKRYAFPSNWDRHFSKLFNTAKRQHLILDKTDGQLLGTLTRYGYFGGWLVNSTGLHVTATMCPLVRGGDYRTFLVQIFRSQNPQNTWR